jgi:hypothetical protein
MIRRAMVSMAFVPLFAATVLVATSNVPATAAGKLCPKFSKSGLTYQWEVVGTGFTCASAKKWVVKLSNDHADTSKGKVALTNGPKGYHCFASLDTKGLASGGLCYKGTLAFPKSGFTWNGS